MYLKYLDIFQDIEIKTNSFFMYLEEEDHWFSDLKDTF